MMGVLQGLSAWLKTEGDLDAQLAAATARLEAKRAAKPTSADPADHRQWRAEIGALEGDVADIRESLRIAAEQRAAAEAAKKDADDRATVEDYRKEAKLIAARVRKLPKQFEAIASELEAITEHAARANEVQALARKLGLPPVADGERLVREIPAKSVPAKSRRVKGWFDRNNEPCPQLIERDGQMVPVGMSGDYSFREIEVVESREQFIPARMPERLGEATVLPGVWPRK